MMQKLCWIIGCWLTLFVSFGEVWSYSGPKLVDVSAAPHHDAILELESGGLVDVWGAQNGSTHLVVEGGAERAVAEALRRHGLAFRTVVADLLDTIKAEEEHLQWKRSIRRRKRDAEQMDWTTYHELEDIEGYMGWLNFTHHHLVTVIPVATTQQGRPVYVVRVSDPAIQHNKKKIWIEGGIHAREWISPAATTFLLHQVATSDHFRSLLASSDWFFVPVANPDGYAYSFSGGKARMWRKNRRQTNRFLPNRCRGVDLNRNWVLKWGVGGSGNPCSDTYKGPEPFSEPETDGLRAAMSRFGPFDLFVTFHSYGQAVLYPWGWTTEPPPNAPHLAALGDAFASAVRHASRGRTRYDVGGSAEVYGLASGASDDWAYGALGAPFAFTIELRDNGKHGFLLPEAQIEDTVREAAVGLYCMASVVTGGGQCAGNAVLSGGGAERRITPRGLPRTRYSEAPTKSIVFE